MGMTANQMALVCALAENKIKQAKQYAIACCAEDTTKKNERDIRRAKALLENREPNFIELPHELTGCLQMEDCSDFQEGRYFLGANEKRIFETIKKTNEVSLRLLELKIPYLIIVFLEIHAYAIPFLCIFMFF